MTVDLGNLGTRVVIVGASFSGKSTLALRLGPKLGLPVHHLDSLFFTASGELLNPLSSKPAEKLEQIVQSDNWIIEGAYSHLLPRQLARATSVIHLNPRPTELLARYLRYCQHVREGTEMRLPFNPLRRTRVSLTKKARLFVVSPLRNLAYKYHMAGCRLPVHRVPALTL